MSSSSSSTPDTSSSTSSAAPSQSQSGGFISAPSNQATFYRNLFYILIGILGFFALISLLSLLRARRRRRTVIAEAIRLGVLVPGMDGYVTLRDRQNVRWTHKDGTISPDWWEIGATRWMMGRARTSGPSSGYGGDEKRFATGNAGGDATPSRTGHGLPGFTAAGNDPSPSDERWLDTSDSAAATAFRPLGVVPPITAMSVKQHKPIVSTLPFFPTLLAYRADDLLPPPPKWESSDSETLHELGGAQIDVVTIIKMPGEEAAERRERKEGEEEDGEEVLREWGGICLGVARLDVQGQRGGQVEEPRNSVETIMRRGRLNLGKARDTG